MSGRFGPTSLTLDFHHRSDESDRMFRCGYCGSQYRHASGQVQCPACGAGNHQSAVSQTAPKFITQVSSMCRPLYY